MTRNTNGGARKGSPGNGKKVASRPRLRDVLQEHERAIVEGTLRAADWNVTEAARVLGLSRVSLHRKMQLLDIHRPLGKK